MKNKRPAARPILSLFILCVILSAALAESRPALAQDGAPEFSPTPTLTATPTETPTEESSAAQAEGEPTGTPQPLPTDTPENVPTEPTDSTGMPEEATVEALEAAPTATQGAEIVPLVMPEDTSNIIPGEYIVVYKKSRGDTKTLKAGRDKVREKGGQIRASYSAAIKGFSARLTDEALRELRTDPNIAYIEPDQYIHAVDGDFLPLSTPQILPGGESGYWGLDRIDQATKNRDYRYYYPSSAGTGVHVYVLDSGILTSHTQFDGRASNDYDLINDGRSESEYYFHGTAVASIVGGEDYGVAKNVYLHSVRVLKHDGYGSFTNVINALNWVIANHASPAVVNMSLGGSSVSSALNSAVASTVDAGITVVVSSGNQIAEKSWDACNWSPASAPPAITVGATTSSDSRDTAYSTYGTCLDLFAPGTNIISATNTSDTAAILATGTSMAAPMVAGAAALYLADHPSATPAEVTSAILGVATSGVLSNIGTGSPNLLLFVYGQVVLVSPANEALINQSAPTLSWRTGYSGDVYTLEVDDSSAFDSLFYTTETENASAEVAGLTEGTWYWRVRAENPASGTTEWSETFSFTVDLTPPDAPLLSSPADNTYRVGTPAFAWSAVDTAVNYQFQYGTSSDPEESAAVVYQSGWLTATNHTPPSMTREVQYYWFARARDAAGNPSDWSSPFRIMIVPAGPSAPALSTPANGAFLNDDTPEFTWAANTNPDVTYHIQISTNSGFSSILQEADDLPAAAYTATLLEDKNYFWRVRGKSKYGIYGGWSSIRYFTIDTERPEAPSLVSPVSGARTVGEPMFAWSAVTGATAYQLALSLSDNLKDSESEEYIYISPVVSGTSYTPAVKNKNVTYYWNARARDAAGNWSYWSKSNFLTIVADTPAQASLADPLSGKLLNDNTPTLSWKLLMNSEYYHLQVADNSAFNAPIIEEDGLTGTSYTVETADALADGTYYWRVRGRNNSSDYGAWSSSRNFKVDTSAPDAPQAVYPLNEAAVIGTPTFKWSRPAGARYYQLRYADADEPATILYTSGEITSYYLKPPAMDVMNTYLWSVRAIDAAGNPSGWSTPVSVTILPPSPGRPVLSAPASATVINPDLTALELEWQASSNAASYQIQVSTRTSFTAPYLVRDEADWEELSYDPDLADESTYYWRVRAENANGVYGSWSSVRYFRVDKTAPDAPTLYSPKNNTEVTGTPTFQWLRAGDAVAYEFAYNTSDDPETALYNSGVINRTAVKPPAMDTGTLYYWFVRAYDKAGNQSDWSAANTVTILAPKPASPVLNLPATASILSDTTPALSWNAVDYGEFYDVQLSTKSGFSPLSREATDLDVLTYTPEALPEARYYWRVRAKNENGTAGAWSSTRYFTVDTSAPAAPALRAPTDGVSITGWPTLSWYAASGARYYQVAYGTENDPDAAEFTSDWITATNLKVTGMDLNTPYYWFVRSKDYAGNISENWSAARQVTVKPSKPLRVTLAVPASGTATDDATVELGWGAVSFGNTYEVQVDDSSYFSSVNYSYTSAEEATSLTTGELAPGKWYWRARACNVDDICGSWSYSRSLIIYGKFDTEFGTDGDSQGWTDASGAGWAAATGALSTDGLTGGHSSSAAYDDMIFTDFTYEAAMKMDAPASGEANSYGLVLRGTPTYDAWNDWTRGVYFTIRQVNDGTTQYACALAYRIVSGSWSYLGGSCGEALYDDWNSLKVYAKGTAWKFYVNDYLILSTSVSSITSGRLGVVSWGQSAAGTDVDAASAGGPVVPTALTLSLSAQTAPVVDVDPEQVFEAMRK